MVTVPQRITPLDWRTAIVNPNGTPNNYFIRLWQVSFVNQDSEIARIEALENATLQAGTGITISPDGHLLSNPTISADVQALLNVISTTQGAVLYRGAASWAALVPGTSGYFLQTSGPAANPTWAAGSSGTITSIASGNGMNFSTITTTGTVTLGTPSSVTLASTNSVTATSHTHAFAPGGTTAQYIRGDGSLATYGGGTVTSVSGSGGTTGLTLTGGPITGSGTLTLGGTLAVANGGTGATTSGGAPWVLKAGDTMTGALTINAGSIAPTSLTGGVLYLGSGAVSTQSRIVFDGYGATIGGDGIGNMIFRKARYSAGTIQPLQSGDYIGQITGFGCDVAGSYSSGGKGYIAIVAAGNWASGDTPTKISFYNTPVSSTTPQLERLTIEADGSVSMGGTSNTVIDANRSFYLRQYTVATLPAAGTAGRLAAVTDALGPTYGAVVVGGGTVNTPVYDNGTNWTCR